VLGSGSLKNWDYADPYYGGLKFHVSTCQLLSYWAQADMDMFDVEYLLCRWSAKPWPKSGFVGELGVMIRGASTQQESCTQSDDYDALR
jgi:hypothetical protein